MIIKNVKNKFYKSNFISCVKRYFKFDSRDAVIKKEIIGGLSTFLAMCYILTVNPSIVGNSAIIENGIKVGDISSYHGGLFLTTVLSSFFGTLLMGLWARVPIVAAPGMGLNAFFAFTISQSIGFGSALSITIISGVLYFILAITPARKKISEAIPNNFKIMIGSGIGLFIAYIGLKNSGIIVSHPTNSALVSSIGDFSNPLVILALILMFLGLILYFTKVPSSTIITMLIGAIIVIILCVTKTIVPLERVPTKDHIAKPLDNYGLIGSYNDFATFTDVVKAGWLGFTNQEMWTKPITYIGILSFLYVDFFDTTSSLIVIDKIGNFSKVDKKWIQKVNCVDSICTFVGAGIGSTTVTVISESAVGIVHGSKTGISSIIVSLMLLLSLPLWPILNVFMPINLQQGQFQPVTSPALIVIGAIMLSQMKHFDWSIHIDIPTMFIIMVMMLLTNSIASGLAYGMFMFVTINLFAGILQKIRKKEKSLVINSDIEYFKRINLTSIVITIIGIIYIICDQIL